MIDVEVDIYNDLAERIYAEFPEAFVSSEHVEVPARFPAVSIIETTNVEDEKRIDSSGDENAATLTYTVDVYSNSESNGKTECKRIVGIINDRLRFLNFNRVFSRPTDNVADPTIYRMTARFTGTVDKNNVFYGR